MSKKSSFGCLIEVRRLLLLLESAMILFATLCYTVGDGSFFAGLSMNSLPRYSLPESELCFLSSSSTPFGTRKPVVRLFRLPLL